MIFKLIFKIKFRYDSDKEFAHDRITIKFKKFMKFSTIIVKYKSEVMWKISSYFLNNKSNLDVSFRI